MKTLSNAELKEAITTTIMTYHKAHEDVQPAMLSHLQELLLEQRVRATQSVTLETMTTTLERAELDARVAAQDGPEWVEWNGGECPLNENDVVDIELRSGSFHIGIKASEADWLHNDLFSKSDLVRYRNWTAWEQSK